MSSKEIFFAGFFIRLKCIMRATVYGIVDS